MATTEQNRPIAPKLGIEPRTAHNIAHWRLRSYLRTQFKVSGTIELALLICHSKFRTIIKMRKHMWLLVHYYCWLIPDCYCWAPEQGHKLNLIQSTSESERLDCHFSYNWNRVINNKQFNSTQLMNKFQITYYCHLIFKYKYMNVFLLFVLLVWSLIYTFT